MLNNKVTYRKPVLTDINPYELHAIKTGYMGVTETVNGRDTGVAWSYEIPASTEVTNRLIFTGTLPFDHADIERVRVAIGCVQLEDNAEWKWVTLD